MTAQKLNKKIRPQKPPRPYGHLIKSLTKVLKIYEVKSEEAIISFGSPNGIVRTEGILRFCIWNICKGAGGISFEHDFTYLLRSNDLFLVQEALLSTHSIQKYHDQGVEVIHAASYKRADGLRDGVMTMAKIKALGAHRRILCKTKEPLLKTPKVALVSFYESKLFPEPLMVVNIHATLIRTVQGAREELEHLLENLPSHNGPAVIAGDFNTFTKTYLHMVKTTLFKAGFNYVPFSNEMRTTTAALDQVFVKNVSVVKSQINYDIQSSDHFPILFELKF